MHELASFHSPIPHFSRWYANTQQAGRHTNGGVKFYRVTSAGGKKILHRATLVNKQASY